MRHAAFDSSHFSFLCVQLPLAFHCVYVCGGCTITLLLFPAFLVYVGRSDKKNSCGSLYWEQVSLVLIEGTQPRVCIILLILATYLLQAGSHSSSYKTQCIFLNERKITPSLHLGPDYLARIRRRKWLWRKTTAKLLTDVLSSIIVHLAIVTHCVFLTFSLFFFLPVSFFFFPR